MKDCTCSECGKKFGKYEKTYNVICKKCKRKLLKLLKTKPFFTNKQNEIKGIDYQIEYKTTLELSWINNARYSSDYWMYK